MLRRHYCTRRGETARGRALTCSEPETEENGPRSALEEDRAGDNSDSERGAGLDDGVGEAEVRLGGEDVLRRSPRQFRHRFGGVQESKLAKLASPPPLWLCAAGNLAGSIDDGSGEGALLAHQERSPSLPALERERSRSVLPHFVPFSAPAHAVSSPEHTRDSGLIVSPVPLTRSPFPPLSPTSLPRTRSLPGPGEALESISRMVPSSLPPESSKPRNYSLPGGNLTRWKDSNGSSPCVHHPPSIILLSLTALSAPQMMTKSLPVTSFFPLVTALLSPTTTTLQSRTLISLYITHCASTAPSLALLAINAFQKDLSDPNPVVRAGAIKTLAEMGLEDIRNLVGVAVAKGARDGSWYVRRAAGDAVRSLFRADPTPDNREALLPTLVILLNSATALTIGSALVAWEEIVPTRWDLIHPNYRNWCRILLEVEEWGQCVLLRVLVRYGRTFFLDTRNGVVDPDAELALKVAAILLNHLNPAVRSFARLPFPP